MKHSDRLKEACEKTLAYIKGLGDLRRGRI